MGEECSVCCSKYTSKVRKRVECNYCHEACCVQCLQKYLLGLASDPQCMACKAAFNGEFLGSHLPRTWLLGEYKRHRERVLLEREMALLPHSQHLLENYKLADRLAAEIQEMNERRAELMRIVATMSTRINSHRTRLDTLKRTNYTRDGTVQPTMRSERRQFIRGCPVQGCRGFLSAAWRCGTCDAWVCKDCGEPKGDAHECDPNVAASHKSIQKDSRPCPRCASMIYKISGCDQMWCTQCNVAFSWKTGVVVTRGIIHNPHYFQWRQRQAHAAPAAANPCDGIDQRAVMDAIRSWCSPDKAKLGAKVREVFHVREWTLPALRRRVEVDPAQRNADLRVMYLRNALDQDTWCRKLQQREKMHERTVAEMHVYDMLVAASLDTLAGMASGARTCGQALEDLLAIRAFANNAFDDISRRFNMTLKRLRE